MKKFLYFRTVADEANDGVTGLKTNNPSSFMFNADDLCAMQPTSDTILTLYFKPALAHASDYRMAGLRDTVNLNVTQGDTFEVMAAITDAISNPARGHSDGFITIADDVTTTDSATTALNDLTVAAKYIHGSITSCGTITVQAPSAGIGVHEHYEVVDVPTGAVADDDVMASLGIYIPAQAVLVEAALINVELSGSADASVALEVHTAAIADNAGSAGTEIIGAGAGGGSLPNQDLNFGSGDVLGDVVAGGTLISHESPLFRGTSVSYFHLCAKEGSMNLTGSPKIGVYLKWYGPAAVMTAERLA
jgi:hypothetical protein|tara:strand:- start:462 stop:1376 length:915 start_codon:yes stop_codon:yes gene_type:complete